MRDDIVGASLRIEAGKAARPIEDGEPAVGILVHAHGGADVVMAAIVALGREPGGGLVVMPDAFLVAHRAPLIMAAARNNVPAVYAASYYARDGGLLSCGPDRVDIFRRAATYVDRILRGAKAAE